MNRLLPIVCFVTVAILGVASPLLRGDRYAFRDVSHFYLPLYDYVAERTSVEWLPLWNPLDQAGMPLVGETSTAVLYPVRYAVYLMPLSPELAMNVYLMFHLLLAAAMAGWLARRIQCNAYGVALAAVVYPLSGSVYSLCCNPPFLVSAAWLPLALGACLVSANEPLGYRIRLCAVALGMMVLGGDPQTSLHAVLVVVSVSLAAFVWKTRAAETEEDRGEKRVWWAPLKVCLVASVFALGLSAVQICASLDWSRQSDRISDVEHLSEQYDFSLAPWHVAEIFTARPFGHPFPGNARVARLIPGEGRMWAPSIYAGLIVGLALLSGCVGFRRIGSVDRIWIALALISLLLCMGHFGLVWWLQQIPGVLPEAWSAIGGPYWMLSSLVPGYDSFRYPVKWLPVFALAGSMVAARWISRPVSRQDKSFMVALIVLSLLMVCIAMGISSGSEFSIRPVDEYWGPINGKLAVETIYQSLVSTLFVSVSIAIFRWHQHPDQPRWKYSLASIALLFVASVDVGGSSADLLPRTSVERETGLATRLLSMRTKDAEITDRTLRTQSGAWPERWKTTHSDDRPLEVAVSERIAWFGRWHLADQAAVFNSMVTIRSRAVGEFWRESNRSLRSLTMEQQQRQWGLVREWLGLNRVLHIDGSRVALHESLQLVDVSTRRSDESDFFRVHTTWAGPRKMESFVEEMRERNRVPIPCLDEALVSEEESGVAITPEVTWQERRTARVSCKSLCLLERCQLQDGNWAAEIVSADGSTRQDAKVFRSSLLNQATLIPAGDWTVTFHYQPWWKWPAVFAMAISWLFLLAAPSVSRAW